MNFQDSDIHRPSSSTTGPVPGTDGTVFDAIPGDPSQRLVLLCDHASNFLPQRYGTLGLPASELERHIGYDIGTKAIVHELAVRLKAAAILSRFSRLLIDPNRGIDDPTLVMQISDGAVVPGNAHISHTEREHRIATYYQPYHEAIDAVLDDMLARGLTPVILSVHSFTSTWKGVPRPWHAGVLWQEGFSSFSAPLMAALARDPTLIVGDNEPYAGGLKGDTLYTHGTLRQLPHALIEIRQDLISNAHGQMEWCDRLVDLLPELVDRHA